MQGSRLGLIAAIALLSGSAGCALPQVLPLEGGTSSGPSPYGVWYEQHWATNSVLLAAADQPEEEIAAPDDAVILGEGEPEVSMSPETEAAIEGDLESAAREARQASDEAAAAANSSVEARAASAADDFDNSSPYQFPSSSFQPGDGSVPAVRNAPVPDGPIRY